MRTGRAIPAHNLKMTRSGSVKQRNVFWRMRRWFFLLGLLVVAGVAGVAFVLSRIQLPNAPPVEDQTTFICDSSVPRGTCNQNNALAVLHGEQNRVYVKLDEIPKVMQDSVLAAEDRDFFRHGGVDPLGIARAAYADIRSKGSKQGGSTITQQYIKTVYLSNERTLGRKLKEAVMAVKFEQKYSKTWILEHYLNTIYFGRGAYGVQAASRAYFGHDVQQITLPEAALLAGIIRSPASAEPYKYPAEAKRRRATVLDGLIEQKKITSVQYRQADAWPFDYVHGLQLWAPSQGVEVRKGASMGSADYAATQYFVEYVRQQMTKRYGNDALYTGGLRIYTTLDLRTQKAAYQAVTSVLDQPGDPAGALVALDDQGRIKAMMGGTDYSTSKVNLATGRLGGGSGRQPGSTFKAFALAEAVREGYSIDSVFPSPSTIVLPNANGGKDWTVRGGCCGGRATLVQATQNSVNSVYAQLVVKLGITNVIKMANELGVDPMTPLPVQNSVVLGSGEVSVLDMAAGYSTFANQGVRISPRAVVRVERADGTLLDDFTPRRTQVLTPEQNAKVIYCLKRVVQYGTGRAAQINRDQAGKTGTTQDNRDAWFAGITPRLTAVTWMGYSTPRPMTQVHGQTVQGGNLPAMIWKRFMENTVGQTDTGTFPDAGDVTSGSDINPGLTTTTLPPATTPSSVPGSSSSVPGSVSTTSTRPTSPTTGTTPSSSPPSTSGGGGRGGGPGP